jgi:hypothetical protein
MMLGVRITLTLDDDVALLLAEEAHRTRTPANKIANALLRAALPSLAAQRVPYREDVHHAELAPGLDLPGFNKLADDLEDEAIISPARQ